MDINLSPDDPRPVEILHLRNHFVFAGLPTVVVPAISTAQQLAEKLHAYTRDYGASENTRAKDLYDMLINAADLPVPPLTELGEACAATFTLRATRWPPILTAPPGSWARPWAGFVRDYGIGFTDLSDDMHRARCILEPRTHCGTQLPPLATQHVDLGTRNLGE